MARFANEVGMKADIDVVFETGKATAPPDPTKVHRGEVRAHLNRIAETIFQTGQVFPAQALAPTNGDPAGVYPVGVAAPYELWASDGTNVYQTGATSKTPTAYTVPAVTWQAWADPANPTNGELDAAHAALEADATERIPGNRLLLATTNRSYTLYDNGWQPTTNDSSAGGTFYADSEAGRDIIFDGGVAANQSVVVERIGEYIALVDIPLGVGVFAGLVEGTQYQFVPVESSYDAGGGTAAAILPVATDQKRTAWIYGTLDPAESGHYKEVEDLPANPGTFVWELTDLSPSASDGFTNPANTNTWDAIQQSMWVASPTEATIEIGAGSSPTQKTTLTANRTLAFNGTIPVDTSQLVRYEITPGAFTLTIPAANDPAGNFAQPAHSPYAIEFESNSAGVPIYVGTK